MRPKIEVEISSRVVSYPIANPTHNACAEELRAAFRHVFGDDLSAWPKWADWEIYTLADRMSEARNKRPNRADGCYCGELNSAASCSRCVAAKRTADARCICGKREPVTPPTTRITFTEPPRRNCETRTRGI